MDYKFSRLNEIIKKKGRQEQDINVPDNLPNNQVLLNGGDAVTNAPAVHSHAAC